VVVVPFVSWQVGSVPAETVIAVGVPTVGVTLTVRVTCAEGPLHPLAVTLISTEPENASFHVITPELFIEPAAPLLSDQLKLVLLVAVDAYVVVVVPLVSWHEGSVPAETEIAVGVPTVGVTLTVRVTIADGPLQPFAVTLISTEPEYPFDHVITPELFIDPAAPLLNVQLRLVLFVALDVYVVVVVPFVSWQEGSVPAETAIAVGVPTVGVILTVRVTIAEGPLHPIATTLISTDPENPFVQLIIPVVRSILPAAGLLTDQLYPVAFEAEVE
jgi:hypothetical protein